MGLTIKGFLEKGGPELQGRKEKRCGLMPCLGMASENAALAGRGAGSRGRVHLKWKTQRNE